MSEHKIVAGLREAIEHAKRPNWNLVMGSQARPNDNELVSVTRGSARLARSALRAQNAEDAYHNYMAAELEFREALGSLDEKYL